MATTTAAPAVTVVAAVTQPEAVETVNLTASSAATNGEVTSAPETSKQQQPADPSKAAPLPATAADKPAENPGQTTGSGTAFQGQQDDFYNAIFYFSGMGSVIGSALSEGVYVGEQYRKNAIDADEIERSTAAWRARIGFTPGTGLQTGGRQLTREDVVIKARGQAQNLSSDFGKLQTLLESLPVFTGNADQLPPPVSSGTASVDQPIHGELYFRCKERFPVQPGSGSRATPSTQSFDSVSVGSGTGSHVTAEEHTVRRRKNYDDAVLADVARAAVESFPLMPTPRPSQPGSRGSTTPVPDGSESVDQRRARRRDVNATGGSLVGQSPSPGPTGNASAYYSQQVDHQTYGPAAGSHSRAGIKSWQMSHVRPFEDGVY